MFKTQFYGSKSGAFCFLCLFSLQLTSYENAKKTSSKLTLHHGMDFRFSGNNGNIIGKKLDTRYSAMPSKVWKQKSCSGAKRF